MDKKKPNRDLLTIAIFTLITVIVWIGITVYQSFKISTTPKIVQEQLKPLRPDFDTEVIDALNLRRKISQEELDRLPPRILELGIEGASEIQESTYSAQPKAVPEEMLIEESSETMP